MMKEILFQKQFYFALSGLTARKELLLCFVVVLTVFSMKII